MRRHVTWLLLCLLGGPALTDAQDTGASALPYATAAGGVRNVVDLQSSREEQRIPISGVAGRAGVAALTNLDPEIGAWYLLRLEWEGSGPEHYHLENPLPRVQSPLLHIDYPGGLVIETPGDTLHCELWSADTGALEHARRTRSAYAPLCGARLYLRNPVTGHRSKMERVTDFLRDHIWGGERIVVFVREHLYRDAFLETAEATDGSAPEAGDSGTPGTPSTARIDRERTGVRARPGSLGIEVDLPADGQMIFGTWYPTRGNPGIYASLMRPDLVPPDILAGHRSVVKALDEVETKALVYLVAFDLTRFELGYELGTIHPRTGWSERSRPDVRDARLPGPDGIDSVEPLVATGMVNPAYLPRTVATFTGGFKRSHGAFRYGELASRNAGSHYGFLSYGVVFSRLQPGLATLAVLADGRVELGTWREENAVEMAPLRHARQNGVAIIEPDAAGEPVPGALVGQWSAGNWAASKENMLRTVRAGACLQESVHGRFLLYGYFSSATPSAMARVFQAYDCRYAMLLDMNALEHTYLAVYRRHGGEVVVQHLVRGMEEVDTIVDGRAVPRFIGYPDSRDFFFVMRRERRGTQ